MLGLAVQPSFRKVGTEEEEERMDEYWMEQEGKKRYPPYNITEVHNHMGCWMACLCPRRQKSGDVAGGLYQLCETTGPRNDPKEQEQEIKQLKL